MSEAMTRDRGLRSLAIGGFDCSLGNMDAEWLGLA